MTLFDAGARTMTRAVASAGAKLGGITRVVLGHGHTDHRGVAPALGVPVLCHPDEVQDAEGSGGWRYWPADLAGLPPGSKQIQKLLHRYAWDGGPVQIAGTVSEGDEVVGLSRGRPARPRPRPDRAVARVRPAGARQRLLLHARHVGPRLSAASVPAETYNYDTEQARASIRKLAELEPAAAWAGHAKPVTGDVRGQLLKRRRSAGRASTPESPWASATAAVAAENRRDADELVAPNSDYTDAEGSVLTLRGVLSPASRREYARVLAGEDGRPAANRRTRGSGRSSCCSSGWRCAGRSRGRRSSASASCCSASARPRPRSARGSARCCASTAPSTSRDVKQP